MENDIQVEKGRVNELQQEIREYEIKYQKQNEKIEALTNSIVAEVLSNT